MRMLKREPHIRLPSHVRAVATASRKHLRRKALQKRHLTALIRDFHQCRPQRLDHVIDELLQNRCRIWIREAIRARAVRLHQRLPTVIHDALDGPRDLGPKRFLQVHRRDGDVGGLGIVIFPRDELARCLAADRRGLRAIPNQLRHLHHPLIFARGSTHREKLVRAHADALWIRISVGPV